MQNNKTPTIEQIAGVEKILQTSKQENSASTYVKMQVIPCSNCHYFCDQFKRIFCRFNGETVKHDDVYPHCLGAHYA